MDDLISRQAAIEAVRALAIALYGHDSTSAIRCAIYKIQNLPSAQPEQKSCKTCHLWEDGGLVPRVRGKWEHGKEIARTMLVDKTLAIEYEDWHCSACGCVVESYEFPRYKFCPNCGVDMRGEKDE